MLSRGYLQSHLLVFIVTFSFLFFCCVLSVCTAENDVISPSTSQNETDSSEKLSQGFETGTTIANEADSSTESTATPALSASLFSSSTTAADTDVEATTDLPSSSSYSSAEKSTVTILPSSISVPSMIITATKVTLGHRMLPPPESSAESKEGLTEAPPSLNVNIIDEESSTDAPSSYNAGEALSPVVASPSSSLTDNSNVNNNNNNNAGVHQEAVPFIRQSGRKSRYHRYHDENYAQVADEQEQQADLVNDYRHNNGEASTEYYREMDGGDSYGDFAEDNDLTEQLPTPMALINPNGEGNNPPLEDDFAEAFKKVNSNGKRRRFRGGRRGRMKLKKTNDTNNDNNASGSTVTEQEEAVSGSKAGVGSEWAAQSTTASPSSASPKFKRYRSTTPSPLFGRSSSSTTAYSVSTETSNNDDVVSNGPVVKNGPKPMILQSVSYDDTSSSSSSNSNNGATPVPQIEKPGNGGHTEKISTYFFSTPSPSARLRLRQKIRESLPTTPSTSTTTTTTTTTETSSAPVDNSVVNNFAADSDVWKNEFSDFPQNQFFTEVSQQKFKIPDFVPLNLGLEPDKQEPVENSLSRPDPAEKKTYSLDRYQHSSSSESPSSSSHGNYDSGYSSSSSTTPKSHKVRRPSADSHSKHGGYEKKTRVSPTVESEAERPVGTEYYAQGSNTEASTTFSASSSSHRPTPGGSHYDRTKDRVIFYNDSPYSTQHSSTAGVSELSPSITEIPPGSSSQTLGSHLSVSEGPSYYENPLSPMVTVDHHYPTGSDDSNHVGNIFTRGQVYPADDLPPIESTFNNGPPDSSHILSPNIVEHAQPLPPPTVEPSDSDDLQHFNHPPYHNNHQQGAFSQNHVEESQHHHQPMGTPDGGDPYGTVEEVPAHSNPSHENHSPHPHHQHPHHSMHPYPPPPGFGSFNPFGSEHPPQSHPHHAPAMPYPPPHNYYPLPPPHSSHHGGEQSLPTHPIPPPPLPPPPPPPSNLHAHHHYSPHHHHHNSFAPPASYEIHSTDNDNNHDIHNNNQLDSHLNSNHIAGSPSEMSHPHGHGLAPMLTPPHEHTDVHSSGTLSSPTAASPPDFPPGLLSNAAPEITDSDPHSAYNNGAPPPPPPSSHIDQSFPPHSHTMATHPDYEPANPPLPHDHPFHNSFIPFPSQDLMQQPHEHHGHDTNSISGAPPGSGPYHPGIVENVPTGRPTSFEPSPLIPSKFTPIPDDVKETDIYNSFGNKPHEGPPSPYEHSHPGAETHPHSGTPEISLSTNHIPEPHQHAQQHYRHPNDQVTTYLEPTGTDDHSSYHPHHPHHHHHPHQSSGSPTPDDHSVPGSNGYSGPVNEIHSGIYHPPPSSNDPVLSDHGGGGDSYRDHHNHNYDTHDQSPNGAGGYNTNPSHNGESSGSSDYKSNDYGSYDNKPLNEEQHHDHDSDSHHRPHDVKSANSIHDEAGDGKKEKKQKQQASFSNTPYVLMFPQLIPEEKMRPSPPSMLSKEIPVIQASSMSDYTTGPGSGEKPPLGPGFQAVPVHPRHQMYQVLAKTHYEKMMERYRESKKKPPSAIYTPYGILVPVGTNVDAAASMNHNVFSKHRLPPKFRGEKSLLNALLGSPSTSHNRFHPGPVMSNRQTKLFEYEPAIDVLAEKLAMKIVNAQHVLNQKKSGRMDVSEKSDGKSDDPLDKLSSSRNPSFKDNEDHMTMESKIHATFANPDLKDYLKGVLKGHLAEMVETTVSVEDNRRPATLSSKLLNSFFRKGRINMNQPHPPPPPPSPQMLMQPSASMVMSNKIPPPPGMQTQPSPHHHHTGIGHPFPPPILPQGPGGLLGTIRRLFSFAPPEARYDIGVAPNFAGRTLYTNNNGTQLPYIDGPSPRSSHFPPQIILPHPNMAHQHFPPGQHLHSRIPGAPAPSLLASVNNNNNNNNGKSNGESSSRGSASPTPKPFKKKRKSPSGTSSSSPKKPTDPEEQSKWPSSSRLISASPLISSSSPSKLTAGSPQGKSTTTTAKPNTNLSIKSNVGYFHRGGGSNNSSNTGSNANPNSRQVIMNKKPGIFGGSSSNSATSYTSDKSSSKIHKGDSHYDASSIKKTSEIILNKRLGIAPSSSSTSSSSGSPSSDTKEQSSSSNQPPKLDMFQTILGSTRSVLNYFKSAEGRKSSGSAPTVLEPRSATTRKRRSITIISRT